MQFHHPLDVQVYKKKTFMAEVGVAHLPLISDGMTAQRGFGGGLRPYQGPRIVVKPPGLGGPGGLARAGEYGVI